MKDRLARHNREVIFLSLSFFIQKPKTRKPPAYMLRHFSHLRNLVTSEFF